MTYEEVETAKLNQTLLTVTINGAPVTIKVISDNHPDMELAYRLWYEVYIADLKFNLTKGVSDQEKHLKQESNGSVVFLALVDGVCVGTLRATYDRYSSLECDYTSLLPGKKIGELSKLIASRKFRKTELIAQILIACFDYNLNTGNYKFYDTIVISCTNKLLPYYHLFGFKKISAQTIIHPHTRNTSNLMHCSYQTNEKVVAELKELIQGGKIMKVKWAIRYWGFKIRFKENAIVKWLKKGQWQKANLRTSSYFLPRWWPMK